MDTSLAKIVKINSAPLLDKLPKTAMAHNLIPTSLLIFTITSLFKNSIPEMIVFGAILAKLVVLVNLLRNPLNITRESMYPVRMLL